jgi:hypothetical protein
MKLYFYCWVGLDGRMCLGMGGAIHLLPHMPSWHIQLQLFILLLLLLLLLNYISNCWVGLDGSMCLGMGGAIQLLPPYAFMAYTVTTLYNNSISNSLCC